jgi:hypothetical protein
MNLYRYTHRTIKKCKKEKQEKKRLSILFKFCNAMKNKMPMEPCFTPDLSEFNNWESVYFYMLYCSDRWCLSRINKLCTYLTSLDMKLWRESELCNNTANVERK